MALFDRQGNPAVQPQRPSGLFAGDKPNLASSMHDGKFAVTEKPIDHKGLLERLKIEAASAQGAARRASSPMSFSGDGALANFGTGVRDTLASAEKGLGDTLSQTVFGNKERDDLVGEYQKISDQQSQTARIIKERTDKKQDASDLKRQFNQGQDMLASLKKDLPNFQKSTGQVAGELGGVALDALTAGTYGRATQGMATGVLSKAAQPVYKAAATGVSPALGKIAEQRAAGLFTRQGAVNVAKGTGIGYGYDVSQGLQGNRGEGREGAGAFIPGIGTALGAGIPILSEARQSFLNRKSPNIVVDRRVQELDKITSNNASVRRVVVKAKEKGVDAPRILAETDLLKGSVDNTGTIRTQRAIAELNDFIKPQEDVISRNLEKEGRKLPVAYVERQLKKSVMNSNLEGDALASALHKAEKEAAGYALRADKDGFVTLAKIHDAKVNKYANLNYLDPNQKQADKVIARTLKEIVVKHTKSVDAQVLNDELGQHYTVLSLLEKLDGKKVEGGRLGKHFARIFGTVVGSHFGPLGAIVGGEIGAKLKGASMQRTFGGASGGILEKSAAMKAAIKQGKANPTISLGGEANQSLSASPKYTSTANTTMPNKINISTPIPQEGYVSQGVREGKEILQKGKEFLKKPKLGLSIDDVSKDNVYSELKKLGNKTFDKSIKTFAEVDEIINKIENGDATANDLRRGFEIIQLSKKPKGILEQPLKQALATKVPVKDLSSRATRGEGGKFTGSRPILSKENQI